MNIIEAFNRLKENGFVQFWIDFIRFCSINLIGNYIKLVTCLKSLKNKLSIKLLIQYGGNLSC